MGGVLTVVVVLISGVLILIEGFHCIVWYTPHVKALKLLPMQVKRNSLRLSVIRSGTESNWSALSLITRCMYTCSIMAGIHAGLSITGPVVL